MLTDADKDRIRSEELFRSEVQKDLQKNNPTESKLKRLWTASNSAFVIWVLSTLVVGGISFLYTKWEKGREEERRNHDNEQALQRDRESTIRKLDIEIASRLAALNNLVKFKKRTNQDVTKGRDLLILEGAAVSGYSGNVIPEFANRNFQSLLYELSLRIRDDKNVKEDEKKEIQDAYEQSKQLGYLQLFESFIEHHSINPVTKDVYGFTRPLQLQPFNLQRWDKPLKSLIED